MKAHRTPATSTKPAGGAVIFLTAVLLCWAGPATGLARAQDFSQLPVKGMVTMIDLGATECVPCKMMAPIMEKMEKKYHGKAAIVFIDVWKNRDQVARFGIRAIPTQIFYDANGREVSRHLGFMSEAAIVDQLIKMGVE
jgi:thioredoxin 1